MMKALPQYIDLTLSACGTTTSVPKPGEVVTHAFKRRRYSGIEQDGLSVAPQADGTLISQAWKSCLRLHRGMKGYR